MVNVLEVNDRLLEEQRIKLAEACLMIREVAAELEQQGRLPDIPPRIRRVLDTIEFLTVAR